MAERESFKRWKIQESDVENLSHGKVRDMIIRCLFEAQKDTFATAKKELGTPSSDKDIYASIESTVRKTFREVGESFENPNKQGLIKVIDVLARKSASWGTPKDIITHNKLQIRKIINLLKE